MKCACCGKKIHKNPYGRCWKCYIKELRKDYEIACCKNLNQPEHEIMYREGKNEM